MRALSYIHSVLRRRLGHPTRPRMLTWILTWACNARCVMCDCWRKPKGEELDAGACQELIAGLPRLDAVRLSGGEPFLRRDLPEIVEALRVRCRPCMLHLTTNGFLTDRIVRFCERRDRSIPLHLLISIDGVGPVHNRIRGREDAWEKVMATVGALARRTRQLNLRLAANQTVVDSEGLEEYGRLRDYLSAYGIRNQLVVAYEGSATYSLEPKDWRPDTVGEFPLFGDLERGNLRRHLGRVLDDLKGHGLGTGVAKRYYLQGLRNRLLDRTPKPNPPCAALHSHLRLLPDGGVPVCQFNVALVGNLARDGLAGVWQGEAAERWRRWVDKCPGCWAECEILPSAVYSGDLLLHMC